jgi:hypothetical protein
MEPLDSVYAALILIVVPLLVLAVIVAAFLPREKLTEVLRRLRRLQF